MNSFSKNYFSVIDTETNFDNNVISIGIVIADSKTLKYVDSRYFVILPEAKSPSMYTNALYIKTIKNITTCSRQEAVTACVELCGIYNVDSFFAYNAVFDYNHLPELHSYRWFDIMRKAAYKQFNPCIPQNAECYSTGKLKRNYSVEAMIQLLTNSDYHETHNALYDAYDELRLMRLLGLSLDKYCDAELSRQKSVSNETPFHQHKQKPQHKSTTTAHSSTKTPVLTQCNIGDRIIHRTFGFGVITSTQNFGNDKLLEIDFALCGKKQFLLSKSKDSMCNINI